MSFPHLAVRNNGAEGICVQTLVWTRAVISPGHVHRRGIAGSFGNVRLSL